MPSESGSVANLWDEYGLLRKVASWDIASLTLMPTVYLRRSCLHVPREALNIFEKLLGLTWYK